MDDNDSTTGKRSGPAGQATVAQGPLQPNADSSPMATAMFVEAARVSTTPEPHSTPSKPPGPSNATVLGSPLEGALQSSPSIPPISAPVIAAVAQTSFGAPVGAIAKTVTEIPPEIAKTASENSSGIVKTTHEIPPGIAKTAMEARPSIPSIPSITPPPSRAKPAATVTIPVLPVALGAGALVAGVVLFAVVLGSSKNSTKDAPFPFASASVSVSPTLANDSLNPWIRVDGAAGKVIGVSDNDMPPSVHGFRPAQQLLAPAAPFDMQQHEITWDELDPWIEKNPVHAFPKPTTGLTSADARKSLPAYGVPWNTALEYCRAMGATLPTEEQWELAARGSAMNKFPWGNTAPDWSRVHAFKGEMAGPAKVMSNGQDRTAGPAEKAIHDLAGNVQEWTFSVWRNDVPDKDESWVQAQGTTVYAVRGLPLHRDVPGRIDELSVAHRDWICATGDCSPLSSGATAKERARTPKLELWAAADSTQPGALEWRRIIEKSDVVDMMARCFSGPTTTILTVKATKETFCKRPEQLPSNGTCEGQPALIGSLARVTGGLPETALKCVNYALHDTSAKNASSNLPETQFSYATYVSTNPQESLRHVGFRCVREVRKP